MELITASKSFTVQVPEADSSKKLQINLIEFSKTTANFFWRKKTKKYFVSSFFAEKIIYNLNLRACTKKQFAVVNMLWCSKLVSLYKYDDQDRD
jgi:hypothetical protein